MYLLMNADEEFLIEINSLGTVFDEDFRGAIKFGDLYDAETFRDAINTCFVEDIQIAKVNFEILAKKKQTIEPLEIEE